MRFAGDRNKRLDFELGSQPVSIGHRIVLSIYVNTSRTIVNLVLYYQEDWSKSRCIS